MTYHTMQRAALAAALAAASLSASAADWSDTSIGYRFGTRFAEPFNPTDITKHVIDVQHASGYAYGTNFFNVDFLLSDKNDPSSAGATSGAHEAYIVYRHTLDFAKIGAARIAFGPVRSAGATLGFDANSKTDAGYNSKKRMLVAGPTLMLDVPGFMNVSLLAIWESNAPYSTFSHSATPRYRYDTHALLTAAWGIPFKVAGVPLSFAGYVNYIGAKGKNEFGGDSKPETNLDMQIMYDVSALAGAKPNTFKLGLEYQYWRNKFGNDARTIPGATARTPMVRAEYHF